MPPPKGHFTPCLYVSATTNAYQITTTEGEIINKPKIFEGATVPIMNFLGVCHALHYLEKKGEFMPIYTNLITTIAWVKKCECGTTVAQNDSLFNSILNAEEFLKSHRKELLFVTKWETKEWGEIPTTFEKFKL